jgi:hypothetical protein
VLLRLFGIRVRRTPRGYAIKAAIWAAVGGLRAAAGDSWPAIAWFVVAGGYGAVGALALSATRVGGPAWYVHRQARAEFRKMLSWHPVITIDKQGIPVAPTTTAWLLSWDGMKSVRSC